MIVCELGEIKREFKSVTMGTLIFSIIALGLFEVVSNLYYLPKGNRKSLPLVVYTLPVAFVLFFSGTVKGETNEILNNLIVEGQFVFPFSLTF